MSSACHSPVYHGRRRCAWSSPESGISLFRGAADRCPWKLIPLAADNGEDVLPVSLGSSLALPRRFPKRQSQPAIFRMKGDRPDPDRDSRRKNRSMARSRSLPGGPRQKSAALCRTQVDAMSDPEFLRVVSRVNAVFISFQPRIVPTQAARLPTAARVKALRHHFLVSESETRCPWLIASVGELQWLCNSTPREKSGAWRPSTGATRSPARLGVAGSTIAAGRSASRSQSCQRLGTLEL